MAARSPISSQPAAGPVVPWPPCLPKLASSAAKRHNQRVMVMNSVASAAPAVAVSPADLNIYEYDWSPNGEHFVAIAAPGPADNNWWTAKLYSLDLHSKEMKLLYAPPANRQLAVPRWSPDGHTVAFIGGLMSDEGFLGGDIFALSPSGDAHDLTSGIKASASWLRLAQRTIRITFTEDIEGGGGIATLEVPSGKSELLWKGEETLHEVGNYPNFSLAKDGVTSAGHSQHLERWPPKSGAGKIGEWRKITKANIELKRLTGVTGEASLGKMMANAYKAGWFILSHTSRTRSTP